MKNKQIKKTQTSHRKLTKHGNTKKHNKQKGGGTHTKKNGKRTKHIQKHK